MFNLPNLSSKALLLSGASLAAILITAPAQATTLGGMTGRTSAQINATINPATNRPGGPLSPGAAAQQTSQSTADFSTALARIQGQLSAQASARSVAATGPNNLGADPNHPGQQLPDVPNGLGAGALTPSANVSVDPLLWQNADAPTQATSGANTTVTIHQNAQKAILTWDSFNVGKNTTVHFDQTGGSQSDGTNNWIALNRIVDPSDRPSQILGNITAEGSVYLINNNGIIFGGSSQVNVHTLIASSLSFLGENINGMTPGSTAYDNAVAASNSTFLTTGIAAQEATGSGGALADNVVLGVGGRVDVTAGLPPMPGDIVIQAGASITTHENGTQGDGGLILIAAPNVNNAGSIVANDGQAVLVAGIGVSFSAPLNTTNDVNDLKVFSTGQYQSGQSTDVTPVSNLTNTGLIESSRGYIDLLGTNVTQNGTVFVSTGVSYPGGITITAADEVLDSTDPADQDYHRGGVLLFSSDSLTTDLPEEDGETATSSPSTVFTPGSIALTGSSITFNSGSLLEAPGANVTMAALIPDSVHSNIFTFGAQAAGSPGVAGRIYIDTGATVDVAGLTDVELPAAATLFTIPVITANEIAGDPNQAALLGLTNIVGDSSVAGTTSDGVAWVGTPILNASGYAQLIPRKIDQLLTNAGSITLSGNEVITAPGSSLDLDGGYTHYLGGTISTTRLMDSNGLIADIGHANPNDVYVGVAGVNTLNHNRWGINDEYTNSLIAGAYYQPDYIAGGNAGTLTIFANNAVVLDGSMSAQALPGLKQVASGPAPSGTPSGGSFLPIGGTFDLGDQSSLVFSATSIALGGEPNSVIIQDNAPRLSYFDPNFNADTPFDSAVLNALDPSDPNNVLLWHTVPGGAISAGGFANVKIVENKLQGRGLTVAEGASLSVQPGGSITYSAGVGGGPIIVLGDLVAPSGTVSLSTQIGDITVGPNAVISVAGQWINDIDLVAAPGAATFINGGSITLSTGDASAGVTQSADPSVHDTSGSILLDAGSVLDVSGGGVMLAGGLLSNDSIPEGKGGSVTLRTYYDPQAQFGDSSDGGPALPSNPPTNGRIAMDGAIESAGFSGGGTLTIQALGFQIGGDPSQAPSWDLYLPEDFFEKQGFGAYQLNAMYDAIIAPGANVRLTQQDLIPNLKALANASTGSDLNASGLTSSGTLDPYHRQATDLDMTAGGWLTWSAATAPVHPQYPGVTGAVTLGEGASINADAGASIGLGSPVQVTVLGSITAPGGSITLAGDTDYFNVPGMITTSFVTPSKSVWLGSNAVLDVAGTALFDPYGKQVLVDGNLQTPTSGKVLDGGSVFISDDTGYVVAEAGSIIDVSGTTATFDEPQASNSGSLASQTYGPQLVWSNAGSIVLGAEYGLFFDGTLKGHAGASQAQGGTLTILPEYTGNSTAITYNSVDVATPVSASGLIIQQDGNLVPSGLSVGETINDPTQGMLEFSADRLDGSGISTLVLGGTKPGAAGQYPSNGPGPVPVAFAGNVTLSLGNAVVITASQIEALAAGTTSIPPLVAGTASVGGTTISINAPYVEIAGPAGQGALQLTSTASLSDATLNVNASFIDLENQFSLDNFGTANFTSSGDIRLSSVNVNSNGFIPGALYTPGNLTLRAADIYPSSGETFILDAVGPQPTTITILGNGSSSTPLSAGGALLMDADNILQSGTLQAPFGSLVLGVGDVNNTDTQTQFGNLPLVQTQSVSLTSGSLTSVSADGATLPYGTTIDGTNWAYSAGITTTLTAPPAKTITLNGVNVALDAGGKLDISGGGELQAEEWVPGTGGSRDVLSQYNVDFSNSSTGVAAPLYPDARNVYAIVPGYSAPVAAYDPVFAQTTQPAKLANGSASSSTVSLGVGQAGVGDDVGKAVYLSGVPGLPAGVYTLLPAKYATLPGAFRVVQNTSASNVVPGQTSTLADGTNLVAGYFRDALNGSRSATPSQFEVQSAATWGKYSQYNLTSADTFFAAQAASAGTATPALPMDAGQLVLAATGSLNLGATLNTAPAKGGAPAEVDIASQDIQIVGSGETALAGYLQLSASDLDALNAGSLLIGGTRTRTSTGVTILADANSVVVSNDAGNPLTGPEIILVTKTDTTGTDPNAANGLRLDPGSVITATGTLPASADLPITIGSTTVSGDGSLVRVSNGAQVSITRVNVPTTPLGSLTVAAGATVNGGAALTLDSSGTLNFDPAATFSGTEIAIDAPSITITSNTDNTGLTGFVVGPNSLAQFANSKQVDLRSYGDLAFNGNLNLTFGENIDFSAGAFTSDGGTVTISAPTVAFTNDLNAPSNNTPVPGQGSLIVDATEIDLGNGSKSLKGFNSVALTASGGIVGQDTGTFDMGGANVTMTAPIYIADIGSGTSLTTTGTLALNGNSGTALTITPVGGAISFTGGSVADNGATIEAPAGNVSLEATSGDLTIASGSLVSSAGVSKLFFDTTEYAPAGAITLTADQGTVSIASGSTLDFSGANGGGAAGSLSLSAPVQTVALNGTIKGNAAAGYLAGSFGLNTGGAVDLDNLATELAASGVNDAITVQTHAGNLTLSAANTITAHIVSLTADGGTGGEGATDGNITINGTIDASGNAGGEIDLYGKSSVDLEGSLIARGLSSTERGGTVNIGTVSNVVPGTASLDPTYGYEEVSAANSGSITLGANALIDVSGGTKGGLSNGTVSFRAPLLDAADNHGVNVFLPASFNPGKGIVGSRATTLEAYAVWSTDDPVNNAAQHFDGIVDPAGWYNASGTLLAGSFTDAAGNAVASWDGTTLTNSDNTTNDLSYYLTNDYFAPTAANTDPNRTAHETFYGYVDGDATAAAPGTLMGFVENFPISSATTAKFANIPNFAVTPGIELDNPDPNINNGNISILTNWNLGAGTSPTQLAFRFNGAAPVITFRAKNDVKVDASLSDGFFQIENPINPSTSATVYAPNPSDFPTATYLYGGKLNGYNVALSYYGVNGPKPQYAGLTTAPAQFTSGDPAQIAEYYALYKAYADFLLAPTDFVEGPNWTNALAIVLGDKRGTPSDFPKPPSAIDQATTPQLYLEYLVNYRAYLDANYPIFSPIAPLAPPIQEPVAVIPPGVLASGGGGSLVTFFNPAVTDNTPSPQAAGGNPMPLLGAQLISGNSSSFRLIAGANLASANPDALVPISPLSIGAGNVSIDGHTSFIDTNLMALNTPTMIRTGNGAIEIAAANDIQFLDTDAPGVIYTAGIPASAAPAGAAENILEPADINEIGQLPDYLVTPAVNPEAAGNINLQAGNDIIGVETVGTASSAIAGPSWASWMQTGNVYSSNQITQASINFGAFDQGVMSIGGDVSITSGRDIVDLQVSLPTSWYLSDNNTVVNTIGGGNLTVHAGRDILSGDYFVASGSATLTAGGLIGSSGLSVPSQFMGQPANEVSTVLGGQDANFGVSARQGVDLGGMVDPSFFSGQLASQYGLRADDQDYSSASSLNVVSTTGDVAFNSLLQTSGGLLPATVSLTAISGNVDVENSGSLYPSATGELSLIAGKSVNLYGSDSSLTLGLVDAPPSSMISPLNPNGITGANGQSIESSPTEYSPTPLHADDTQPVKVYALTGDITDGQLGRSGFEDQYSGILTLSVDKPAQIYAGTDILNLTFLGQNLRDDDITRIVAGRDIWDSANLASALSAPHPSLLLGGPGTFDVEAGRNIGPLSPSVVNTTIVSSTLISTGIDAIGNSVNPYLPHESADVEVLFGVGPGISNAAFVSAYVDPVVAPADVQQALVAFMEQYDAGHVIDTGLSKDKQSVTLSVEDAWAQFQALPSVVQQIFNQKALFTVLTDVGVDYNDPTSAFFHQYARGYQAINTLFPASLGYTANSLNGGIQGADTLAHTGDLDIRGSTIQTQQGGNVTILGPGGQALVGSSSAPPASGELAAGQGVLTLEQGDVDIFTDQSLLLAQSRVFTEQGGDMTIWSSNGDINAGKGAKTIADVPTPIYVCNDDFYCTRDARGEVSGAGISTLQTIPGAAPGDVHLIAPRGTVDAGAAGIRVSGDLFVAALAVANANNIQVQGKSVGLPPQPVTNLTLTTASTAATEAALITNSIKAHQPQTIVDVEITGFGGDNSDAPEHCIPSAISVCR